MTTTTLRTSLLRKTAAVVFAGALLTGFTACQETNDAVDKTQDAANDFADDFEDVDWSKYPEETRDKIEDYFAKDNCEGLNEELDKLDEGKDTELTEALKDAIEEAGCA